MKPVLKEKVRRSPAISKFRFAVHNVYDLALSRINKNIALNLDLGSGDLREAYGWKNADAKMGLIFSKDFTLPMNDNELEFIYCSHLFEHLDDVTVQAIISESGRVLKPGGILRVVVPDHSNFISMYKNGRYEELREWSPECDLDTWSMFGFDKFNPEFLLFNAISAIARDHITTRYVHLVSVKSEPPVVLSPPAKSIPNYYSGPPPNLTPVEIKDKVHNLSDHDFCMWVMNKVENAKVDFPVYPYGHRNDWPFWRLEDLSKYSVFSIEKSEPFTTKYKQLSIQNREVPHVNAKRHQISLFVNFIKKS